MSGVESVELPATWMWTRLRHIGRLEGGAGFPHAFQGKTDEEIPFLKVSDLAPTGAAGDDVKNSVSRDTAAALRATILPEGTVVFAKVGAALTLNRRLTLRAPSCVDNNVMGLIPRHDPRWTYYLLCSLDFGPLANPGAVPSVNERQVGAVQVPLPPLPTQRAIAAYLDRETARIDTLIEKKERLLALLEEKRTALITQAVTKGLDPDVPMKDSGVEWLGEVPAHWEVVRLKRVARLESGHTPSRNKPEYWENCTVPWFTLADVHQLRESDREVVTATKEMVSEIGLANSAARKLPAGTVLLSRTASVGFSAIMGCEMATTQDFVNWTPGPALLSEFLLYVFRGMKPFLGRLTMGSTHQTIYMPDVHRFVGPLPPLREQAAIVEHIRAKLGTIDALASRITHAISLLKEYRSALISAAVTGQIEIPPEDTEEDAA